MIALESLSAEYDPPFVDLDLIVRPHELPVVMCPSDEERIGFVNLLLGLIPETKGRFLLDDQPLGPAQRRARVIVLRRDDALAPELSALENLNLVAALRGLKLNDEVRQRLFAFAGIAKGKTMPRELAPDARLRFSLALNVLGDPALVIALDPPPEVARVLGDLLDDRYALLLVAPTAAGLTIPVTQVHTLARGRLDHESSAELTKPPGRRYWLRLRPGAKANADQGLKSLLGTYPGVTVSDLGKSEFRLDLESEVAATRVIRLMVQAGIRVEEIEDDLGRR